MSKWGKCSLSERRLTPTSQIITADHIPLREGNKGGMKILLGRDEGDPQKLVNDGGAPLGWVKSLFHQEMRALSHSALRCRNQQ